MHGCFMYACDLEQHMIDHHEDGKQISEVEIQFDMARIKSQLSELRKYLEKSPAVEKVIFVKRG